MARCPCHRRVARPRAVKCFCSGSRRFGGQPPKLLTAHEIYEILVGTIGHHTLLYTLRYWHIRAAIRGYYRAQRPTFEAARLLGLWTVSCQRSPDSPPLHLTDLIPYPWDTHQQKEPEEDDPQQLQALLAEARRHNASLTQSHTTTEQPPTEQPQQEEQP